MKFRFLGARDGHVTGSCTQFHYDRKNIQFLVDCGLVQGEGNDETDNSKPFPFLPSEISFILLTHAHLDHCGLIPRLYSEGFSGRVICTRATGRLANIALLDGVKHMKKLYSEQDVKRIRFEFIDERENFGFSRMLPIYSDLFVSFSRTAHILGSASISIGWLNDKAEQLSMVMSGDIGNNTKQNPYQTLLANRQDVKGYPEAIVVESTYGGRNRDNIYSDFDNRLSALRQIVQDEIFEKKAVLIIPAFSLHRTQEILVDLFTVFKNHFTTEDASQSPRCIPNPLFGDFIDESWSHALQSDILAAISTLPDNEATKWKNSIQISEELPHSYSLKDESEITFEDVKKLVSNIRHTYPIDIVLDSPLAKSMGEVYRVELCTRQRHNEEETVHRNRMMKERLGAADEFEVDDIIKSLFPSSDSDSIDVSLGIHSIQYKSDFSTPGYNALKERGCILITGGGMCEGGPVVKHLGKLADLKRPSAMLITGYMAKGSLGSKFISLSDNRDKGLPLAFENLVIGDKIIPAESINTKIIQFQSYYSGHADESGLLNFVFERFGDLKEGETANSTTVFINHGQHTARNKLKEAIESRASLHEEGDRDISCIELPDDSGQWYDLHLRKWIEPEPESNSERLLRELLTEQRKTNNLLARLIQQRSVTFESAKPFKFAGKKKVS